MTLDLLRLIDSWAKRAPDRTAHVSGPRVLTYGELMERSDRLAGQFRRTMADDASPIVVIGHKEPEMLIGFLGAVKSGHPYIPLDISIPRQRIDRIVSSAKAALVLTPERVMEIASTGIEGPKKFVEWEDPYYIIFTSGSTGEPKGVVITLECLTSFVDWMLREQRLTDMGEVFLNQAPFSFDLSVMDLYLCLATGGTLFSITSDQIANPKQLYQAFSNSGISVWVSTPSFAQMSLAEKTFDQGMLPELKRFLFCGETLAPEVASQLLDRFPKAEVWNTYGPTEATCATSSLRVSREVLRDYTPLPVGYPKPDSRIVIMDESNTVATPGERGEIVIAGPNVSTGYLGRPELNARAFFQLEGQRAYRTGDIGRLKEGLLFFDGRKDSQIKLHGYRVELGDIEANLRGLPGVLDAVVIPTTKLGRVDSLAAFLILGDRSSASDFQTGLEIRAKLGERLPSYMIPRKFHFLETFPMTANGKADRRKLEEMLG